MDKYKTHIRLSVTLFVITFAVAGLLAIVNNITAPKIEANESKAVTDALTSIFPGETFTEKTVSDAQAAAGITAIYEAGSKSRCISLNTKGYGGNINLLVGIDAAGTITEIRVISSNETPELGSKVLNKEYLSAYKGLSGPVSFSDHLKPVSGATISSKAVLAGINNALEAAKEESSNAK